MKQTIAIHLTAFPSSQHLRILNIYRADDELIVISKLSSPALTHAAVGKLIAKADVDVESELPVKHYIIGLREGYPKNWLPEVAFTRIQATSDVPRLNLMPCLFTSELTEDRERRVDAYTRAYEARLRDRYKDAKKQQDAAQSAQRDTYLAVGTTVTMLGLFAAACAIKTADKQSLPKWLAPVKQLL